MGENEEIKKAIEDSRRRLFNTEDTKTSNAYVIAAMIEDIRAILMHRIKEMDAIDASEKNRKQICDETLEVAYLTNAMCYLGLSLADNTEDATQIEQSIKDNNNTIEKIKPLIEGGI